MSESLRTVVLAGNPNAGKTTLFNALTGARARTGNYPGVTVERRVGKVALPQGARVDLVDLPGTYSLTARSPEEQVAVDALLPLAGPPPDAVIVVCDAGALARHLYLALQVLETGLPVVIALNMMDEARAAGIDVDVAQLARELDADVVPVVARSGEGLPELRSALARALTAPARDAYRAPARDGSVALALEGATLRDVEHVEMTIAPMVRRDVDPAHRASMARARALWAILSVGDDELRGVPAAVREAVAEVRGRADAEGRSIDREIIAARYARIDALARDAIRVKASAPKRSVTDRIDAVLTHPVAGLVVFAVVMGALFQALFTWSEPMVGAIEAMVAGAQDVLRTYAPGGPLRDLLVDGVIAGVGNVIVFVPQIALLSLFIAVLEDSGYLARVAFVIDRVMSGVGLHGRAFVPLLSGFACAIPAILATRTIENRKDRLVTMLALPLMSCSARLPVYTLVIAVAFPASATLPGGIAVGAVALLAMYALSVITTLGAAAVLRRTVLRGPKPALVLELPPYRVPVLRNVMLATWDRARTFVIDAGTLILAITIVLWGLLSYPRDGALEARYDAMRAEAEATLEGEALDARVASIDAENAAERMEQSFAGQVGRAIEPVIAPLGFDWKIGVGLIASFAAREVLVSTLGIVYGAGEDTDEENDTLRGELRAARHPDGTRVFTPLVGLSLMVFFVLAAQCMSTFAMVKRESGSWKWPVLMVVYMNTLAYLASLLVFQVGRALGFS
ncbi:ferrous iron transport protein B [Sandaracinus amylolyticus]|uniref:ferrous iron transport protein B n=1 Tax=Sandaracinus amylolyticus TaxID=927083 RepID=UPI001F02FFDD|nr:ferrous iron transport protein B [Sandaracinus amylolyticus]UJR80174.1 Ferrous iron transport protein B [Sandaracinus amylolyticus]